MFDKKAWNSARNSQEVYESYKVIWRNDPRKYLLKNAKKRAKRRGLEFTISIEDIKVPTHCPVFGYELILLNEGGIAAPNSMTLDRKNSSKGYTPDNIHVISYRANVLKKDATTQELVQLADYFKGLRFDE